MNRAQFMYKVATRDRSIGVLRALVGMRKQAQDSSFSNSDFLNQFTKATGFQAQPPAAQTGNQQAASTPAPAQQAPQVIVQQSAQPKKQFWTEEDKKQQMANDLAYINNETAKGRRYDMGANFLTGAIGGGLISRYGLQKPWEWTVRGYNRFYNNNPLPAGTTRARIGGVDIPMRDALKVRRYVQGSGLLEGYANGDYKNISDFARNSLNGRDFNRLGLNTAGPNRSMTLEVPNRAGTGTTFTERPTAEQFRNWSDAVEAAHRTSARNSEIRSRLWRTLIGGAGSGIVLSAFGGPWSYFTDKYSRQASKDVVDRAPKDENGVPIIWQDMYTRPGSTATVE